jgi:Xaa-Pro aminopeptidase
MEIMHTVDVDAVVATSPENIMYLTGYLPFQGVWNRFPKYAIFARTVPGRVVLVLPIAEVAMAAPALQSGVALHVFGRDNFQYEVAVEDLDRIDALVAGIMADSAHPSGADALAAAMSDLDLPPNARIAFDRSGGGAFVSGDKFAPKKIADTDGAEILRRARMVKTESEIDMLRRASSINESGIQAVIPQLPYMHEDELARLFRGVIQGLGAEVQHWVGSFDSRSGAHHLPRPGSMVADGLFKFDAGLVFGGYCSDLAGTAVVGRNPTAHERTTFGAISAGVLAGLAAARPGRRSSDVYAAVMDAVRSNGLPAYTYSMCGHGIGVEPRDYPTIAPANPETAGPTTDPVLEPGMVLNIEVPIISLGREGYQHEITFVVREEGPQLLSPIRNLDVVGLL